MQGSNVLLSLSIVSTLWTSLPWRHFGIKTRICWTDADKKITLGNKLVLLKRRKGHCVEFFSSRGLQDSTSFFVYCRLLLSQFREHHVSEYEDTVYL